ncbi:N-acetyltransferase family protein [Empedobacter tilapiae]
MIRIATENDIPELKRMMIKLLQHHQEFNTLYQIDLTYKHDIDDFFKGILQQQNINVFVDEIENQLAGYIICSKHLRPKYFEIKSKGRIDSLYVDSNYRNQNIASKLVEEAINFLNDQAYIELEFTAENQSAKGFWLKNGFQILNHQCILKLS